MANWWPFQACEQSHLRKAFRTKRKGRRRWWGHIFHSSSPSPSYRTSSASASRRLELFFSSPLSSAQVCGWKMEIMFKLGRWWPRLVSGLCICKDLSPRAALSPLLPLWGQSPENIWATPPPAGTSSLVQYAGMVIMPIWDINTFYWYKKCWPPVLSHCHVVCNAKMQLTKLRHSANKKHSCKKYTYDHTEYFVTGKIYDKYNSSQIKMAKIFLSWKK